MIARILKIRQKQLENVISQLGLFRTIFLFALLVLVSLYVLIVISKEKYPEIIFGLYIILILLIQLKRKDKFFLYLYSDNPYKIFFVEYLIISLPILIPLAYSGLWHYLLIYPFMIFLISLLKTKIKKKSVNSVFQRLIPEENFEWKAGIRKNLFLILSVWIIGIVTSFFIASVPIAIFVLGITVLSFYEEQESLQILIANEYNAKRFLWKKIKKHLFIFSILIMPLILLFSILNNEYFYIVLIEYIVFLIILNYTILLKYAFYEPNNKSEAIQIFTMIGIVSIIIPVFIPVVLLLTLKFLFQSLNNLNIYLYDYN